MALYTRRQLLLLFALLGAAGVGLAIREWRATHPDLTERLERLDLHPVEASPAPARRQPPTWPRPPVDGSPVDLNSATPDDLARLPGVGPSLAARIVERRQSVGAFAAVEDLRRVKGIGRAKLERLRQFVTVVP